MDKEVGKLIVVIFLIVVLVVVAGTIIFLSIQHPERRLDVGANIESIEINDNLAEITLSGGANDKEIERVKFIFTDSKGVQHYYSTTEGIVNLSQPYKKSIVNLFKEPDFQGTYQYIIDSNEIGFENFDSIYKVEVVFDYEKDILEVDKEIPLDEEIINEGSKPSRGGGGGGSSFTPDSDLIPTLKAYWMYGGNEVAFLNDIEYGATLRLVLENSGLGSGIPVEFIISEKDFIVNDYLAKLSKNVGSDGYVYVDWIITKAHVDAAENFLEGSKLELYFEIRGIKSGVLKIGFEDAGAEPNCSDGIQNQGETDVDCGGECDACFTGTVYYVSNAGNDNNSGLLKSSSWKTIAKVNSMTFNPGDAILFKRGNTWREQITVSSSGNSTDYITFGAYGSGSLPQILGSEQSIDWTHIGDNIWKSSTEVIDPTFGTPHNCQEKNPITHQWPGAAWYIENNGDITWGHQQKYATEPDFSNLTEEYDWVWIGEEIIGSLGNIHVYSPTDPGTRYASFESSDRGSTIYLNDKEYIIIENLELHFAAAQGIGEGWPGSELHGLIVRNNEISHFSCKGSAVGYGMHLHHSDALIQNNNIHDCGRRSISMAPYDNVDPIIFENVIIENNTLYNGFHTTGIDIGHTGPNILRNFHIRNNLIYEDADALLDDPAGLNSEGIYIANNGPGTMEDFYIYNNVIKYTTADSVLILGDALLEVYVYNNVFYGVSLNQPLSHALFKSDWPLSNVTVKNNIFYNTADSSQSYQNMRVGYQDNAYFDNNLHYIVNSGVLLLEIAYPFQRYYLDEWNEYIVNTGWDINSPDPADPLFVDPENNDFRLREGSPAIDAGVHIPGITDGFMGNAPDIGVFESPYTAPEIMYPPAESDLLPGAPLVHDQIFLIPENAEFNDTVGDLNLMWIGPEQEVNFVLLEDDGGRFKLDRLEGRTPVSNLDIDYDVRISVDNSAFDFDNREIHSIVVRATDQSTERYNDATITVKLSETEKTMFVNQDCNTDEGCCGQGTRACPFVNWNEITAGNGFGIITPGYAYLQKRGKRPNEPIRMFASGTPDEHITVGVYGKGERPVFDGTGVYNGSGEDFTSGLQIGGYSSSGYQASDYYDVYSLAFYYWLTGILTGNTGSSYCTFNDIFMNNTAAVGMYIYSDYTNGHIGVDMLYHNVSDSYSYNADDLVSNGYGFKYEAGGVYTRYSVARSNKNKGFSGGPEQTFHYCQSIDTGVSGGEGLGIKAHGENMIIDHCLIEGNVGNGVYMGNMYQKYDAHANNIKLTNSIIRGSDLGISISQDPYNILIENITFEDNQGGTIFIKNEVGTIFAFNGTPKDILIKGSTFRENIGGIDIGMNWQTPSPENITIAYNLFYDNVGNPIDVAKGIDIKIYNNVFYSNAGSYDFESHSNASFDARNNLLEDGIDTGSSSSYTIANNMDREDAFFVSSIDRDFHLVSGSSPIDAGVHIPGITDGYEGSAPDIGAFEYQSVGN